MAPNKNDKSLMNTGKQLSILIIDDDKKLAKLISTYLSKYQFDISLAEDGITGITLTKECQPHLIIVDLMLPEMDGLSVCRELRSFYSGRIIMLTASDEDMDQVACLELGADDFITKPVHPRVLLARIRMLLRRTEWQANVIEEDNSDTIHYGSLSLYLGKRQVFLDSEVVSLTDAEFNLLWLLASNPEQPLSRDVIMKQVRGVEHNGFDRSIDNRIMALRRKLKDNKGLPKRIITVRGKGYLFVTDQW